jgi:orotate phosphoribosyltransferase
LGDQVRVLGATCVLAPALGGIVIGHEVARALDVRALFAERQDGILTLRRGFSLGPEDKVLVVEDVVTTAGSTRETMAVASRAGAEVVGACAIVDRSGGTHGLELPFAALLSMHLPLYAEADCPMCKQGVAIVKPGSRRIS